MASSRVRSVVEAVAALAVVIVAGLGAYGLVQTKPRTKRKPRARKAALVETSAVKRTRERVTVEASGVVTPARLVELRAEVGGRVTRIGAHLEPGAILKKGDAVAQLDAREYAIALRRARSGHKRALAQLDLEKGQQTIAKREVQIFESENPAPAGSAPRKPLALREPQMQDALALVSDARASMARAQLDLARTRLSAPFDALVRSRAVNVGSHVTPTSSLATLVGVKTWWVEVTVPKTALRWVREGQVDARVFDEPAWGKGVGRDAKVLRVGSEVVEGGRLVKVLIGVRDPLALRDPSAPRLLLGSWVRVHLLGRALEAVRVARGHVHDGDTVWVMNGEGRLDIREVTVAARQGDHLLVTKGLESGDQLVTSPLPYPVRGMQLRRAKAAKGSTVGAASAKPSGARRD